MTLEFHPLANLFPLIEGREFDELVADVKANGLRERVVILDGRILDGRNRYRAAISAGIIDPDAPAHNGIGMQQWCILYLPEYEGDPLAWVLSKNLHRRHLTESQRASVAADLVQLQQGHRTDLSPIGEKSDRQGLSKSEAAEALHVSERSIERQLAVKDHGAPELVEAVRQGQLPVSTAAEIAKLPVGEQIELLRSADPKAFARVAREKRDERQADKRGRRETREADLGQRQRDLPQGKRYGVIYADPEWRFEPYSRESGMDRAPDNHYPTSTLEAIKARPVASIAADDCVLFLWATAPMLPQALEVMAVWGFAYKSHAIWRKAEKLTGVSTWSGKGGGLVLGTGYWFRSSHELLLVGTRGNVPAPAPGSQSPSMFDAPPRRHSEKPDCAYEMIEAYFPNLPKIELNARRARPGWDAWGLEAPEENTKRESGTARKAPGGQPLPGDGDIGGLREGAKPAPHTTIPDASGEPTVAATEPARPVAASHSPETAHDVAPPATAGEDSAAASPVSPPDPNDIIRAGYAADRPIAEIAAEAGLSPNAVKKRAARMQLSDPERQRQAVAESNRRRARPEEEQS